MTAELKALQLKAKHQVYTLLSGHNLSKLHGEGYDFSELREYQMGDDIRKINWTITAKLGKPYIKELHANRELSVVVASFMDAGLYMGTGNNKQKKLTEIATVLGYAAQQSADLFTGLLYGEKETYASAPSKQIYHIEQYNEKLFTLPLLNTTLDTQVAIKDIFKRLYNLHCFLYWEIFLTLLISLCLHRNMMSSRLSFGTEQKRHLQSLEK